MSGLWVLVFGPSGSGKDSVMEAARSLLAERSDIVFARRMVTRPVQAGSDHDPVDANAFAQHVARAELAWYWEAHGFGYGISRRYDADVAAGKTVVVNGSRAHASSLTPDSKVRTVEVSAPMHLLADRLARRGRDSSSAIADRLNRNQQFVRMAADFVVVNDAGLDAAGHQLAAYLITLGRRSPECD